MLEPRQADIPALFLVLVVLPVVVYIILGKWSEASKKKERISLLVEEVVNESFRGEPMATPSVIPLVPPINYAFRECVRCHGPAKTRCSRCKSVRYCSGTCQILHWRQGHKEECRPPDNVDLSFKSPSIAETSHGMDFCHKGAYHSDIKPPLINADATYVGPSSATLDASEISKLEGKTSEKRVSRKSSKGMVDKKDKAPTSSPHGNLNSIANLSKEPYTQHKVLLRGSGSNNSVDDFSEMPDINGSMTSSEYTDWRGEVQPNFGVKSQTRDSLNSTKRGMSADEKGSAYSAPKMNRFENAAYTNCAKLSKSPKSMSTSAREQAHSTKPRKGHGFDESVDGMGPTSTSGSNGTTSIGLTKITGPKKLSKISRQDAFETGCDSRKKVKVLFPYGEFTKFFEHEVFDLIPRGLLNCGNSCYANAVLQCLTCTKPLVIYLLSRTHSRACRQKNWCLMCELEQHVMMLKEAGGPLSPSRILSQIRSTNCQIGDGSQEDAHEFLRLLVASMQSICLEEVGGENHVHPILQETTFVQQTFGGRLRSMVKCLRCHHKSERYENIMDLTLEIFGWVESLEDALTQFTTPEDLDGENMYRCGRCASYVRARKQLSIDEAPNILTIVLKRFQEGNYGKINKCITFPEMLDMIPFMTGTNDIPPLYMLYGVVVHVDTLNASFSGHYISYVKDLQGNWFRIDDSVVQPVPMGQVMSEGAYILFYMRSYPRPPRAYISKSAKSSRPCVSKTHNLSETQQSLHRDNNRVMEFSDATSSSDWSSLFTSSDEASFTSESTRDSFSTVDYSDTCNHDPFSSKFHERPSQRTVSCRMFSGSNPVTRYVSEEKGYILESDYSIDSLDDYRKGGISTNFVNYESSPSDDFLRTFTNCQL